VEKVQQWNSRGHFFAAAAEAMRRLLVENARRKGRLKRGGEMRRHDVHINDPAIDGPNTDVLALDEALSQFACEHPEKAQLVKLRYFAGLTLAEAASALQVSTATADRHWRYARAWLARRLRQSAAPDQE
jgi:RNA polymerase sigma factor (TIGR02999 family)